MKVSNSSWAERLSGKIPEGLAREIDIFETEIALRKQGKIDERLFAETRLRRGVYGQRYDNGQRHDGKTVQRLGYPSGELTKGPNTMWDAPGMQRIKIPAGGLNAEQLETLAELAEEYSDGIAHVTTRQDFQLHYVHIEDTPSVMRRLAAANITTREACGNSVRNVTACPYAGVCPDETFDVTPYSRALSKFLLGHPDCQNFGRKFKHSFSGCSQHACGLASMHDMGMIARHAELRTEKRSAALKCMSAAAWARFRIRRSCSIRLCRRKNCCRWRRRLPASSRGSAKRKIATGRASSFWFRIWASRNSGNWCSKNERSCQTIRDGRNSSTMPKSSRNRRCGPVAEMPLLGSESFQRWVKTNTRPQKQEGYVVVTIALPLGDITANQLRSLADIARRFTNETIRTTVEQNIVLRWVSQSDLPEVHKALEAAGLADPGAGSIVDIAACPGTDTCKLGISSSRGLAAELRKRLAEKSFQLDESVDKLHIKISGCFNSCGQHHVADLGFYGVSRKMAGYAVPHFQVVLGGEWEHNGASYGLPVMAIPSKNIPEVVTRLTDRYAAERKNGESFKDFIKRIGKVELKKMLEDLARPPADPSDRSFFQDWGDPREYTLADMGMGECAGEVVSSVEFDLAAAERELFEAQVALEGGQIEQAGQDGLSIHAAGGQSAGEDRIVEYRGRSGADRQGIPRAVLRHAEILRSLCGRQIRALPV